MNDIEPKIIDLPKILDTRGNLSFFEYPNQLPFQIQRTYWVYDVPGGEIRGSHAFKEQQEFIIALSGSFDVVLNDGKTETKFSLNRSYYGLYVPSKYWRTLENFSTNSLALIVSDKTFDESDYIRDFDEFKSFKNV
ncbi:FdtA/QdtA family cupin domain-containing protein [uncultured Flavobacterium sp.]|uniref:sugar 3,4-ketoisomerase n=1 Tax=uncultured Flavobacterium sp. TaxID=165435 RepID=UPI0025E356B7|nr:FdtA/QdtA family cupin domain-containing protein [uncultured Flavobacterium sp.]